MIKLSHIYKSYPIGDDEVQVLHDVNLHVKKNEFVSVLGPSGSGKTTLMNIIGCLDIPDSGEYILDGESVGNCTEDELSDIRGSKIGFIFQQFNLLPDLTAYENVEMPLLYHKMSAAERHKTVMDTLEQVGLTDRMYHKPSQLSGGQQQRVAIARVLAAKPSIILADEPTGNLDSVSGREILEIIKSLWKQGNTIVMITHDINIAKEADRTVYVYDGVLSEKERGK
ncbi:MAG: ABC transporter ATP-binding protein [Clostridia bacterium]|nr:ABC transporter ATP-binding protein [Clostridia bacterium]MBR5942787.1 ABC transporter ATP-binding protein [Clostridia bacterium]